MDDDNQGVTEDNQSDEQEPVLHPAWYQHNQGEKVTGRDLVDSLDNFFSEIDALGDLISSLEQNDLSDETILRVGFMLINKAKEGNQLVNTWYEQNKHKEAA